mmetsp:Transcript_31280/g.32454  ORF Transcript_31280/g.32454 Transcript_31280/m.32454 type:complete len:270 (-) Transcript_31280:33-842(-)
MSPKELEVYWDDFQEKYGKVFEPNLLPLHSNLLSLAKVNEATEQDSILELAVGCGSGFAVLNAITKAKTFGGDISSNMVKASKEKNPSVANNIEVINNEDLSRFKDGTFRNVISNMSLMIVTNPLNMLKETYRVLDKSNKESSAVFTVWGRPENNFLLNSFSSALKKMNIEPSNSRSNFHLCDKEVVYALCKEAGFENIYLEYTSVILNFTEFKEIEFYVKGPKNIQIFEKIGPEKSEELRKTLEENFNKEFQEKKRMTLEVMVIQLKP